MTNYTLKTFPVKEAQPEFMHVHFPTHEYEMDVAFYVTSDQAKKMQEGKITAAVSVGIDKIRYPSSEILPVCIEHIENEVGTFSIEKVVITQVDALHGGYAKQLGYGNQFDLFDALQEQYDVKMTDLLSVYLGTPQF